MPTASTWRVSDVVRDVVSDVRVVVNNVTSGPVQRGMCSWVDAGHVVDGSARERRTQRSCCRVVQKRHRHQQQPEQVEITCTTISHHSITSCCGLPSVTRRCDNIETLR